MKLSQLNKALIQIKEDVVNEKKDLDQSQEGNEEFIMRMNKGNNSNDSRMEVMLQKAMQTIQTLTKKNKEYEGELKKMKEENRMNRTLHRKWSILNTTDIHQHRWPISSFLKHSVMNSCLSVSSFMSTLIRVFALRAISSRPLHFSSATIFWVVMMPICLSLWVKSSFISWRVCEFFIFSLSKLLSSSYLDSRIYWTCLLTNFLSCFSSSSSVSSSITLAFRSRFYRWSSSWFRSCSFCE